MSTNLIEGLKATMAKATKAQVTIDKIESKIESLSAKIATLAAQRDGIVAGFTGIEVGSKRKGRPSGSKNKAKGETKAKGEGETRGRAENGAVMPFLLKHVSADKNKPTTLVDLEEAHSKLGEPVTLSVRPKVIFMQGMKDNAFFNKIAHGEYVLTASGKKAKDGTKVAKTKAKAPKVESVDTPATATTA